MYRPPPHDLDRPRLDLGLRRICRRGAGPRVDFERDVRPILVTHCLNCHGPSKQKGGIRFDRKTAALGGGDSGPAIIPGKGAESPIVQLTSGLEEDRVMPPKGPRLSAQQVGLLRDWIDQGASWSGASGDDDGRDWWSLRPRPGRRCPRSPEKERRACATRSTRS